MQFTRMIQAVETHSGIPMRVITGGVPTIPGETVYQQMRWLEKNDDQLRLLMLREPRGYPAACCNLVVPAKHPDAAAGYIIMEQVEYPVMSGGNTIAVATVLLETGMIPMQEPVTEFQLEAPAGPHRHPRGLPGREGHAGHLHERPRLRRPPRRRDRRPDARQGHRRRRLGRHVLRHRGRAPVRRARAAARTRQGDHPDLLADPAGRPGPARGRPPRLPGHRHHHLPAVRPHRQPGRGPAERRHHGQRPRQLRRPLDLDRRARPLPLRNRHLREDGRPARQGRARARPALPPRGPSRHRLHRTTWWRRSRSAVRPGVVPTIGGQAWISGFSTHVLDPTDPFANGFTVGDLWA